MLLFQVIVLFDEECVGNSALLSTVSGWEQMLTPPPQYVLPAYGGSCDDPCMGFVFGFLFTDAENDKLRNIHDFLCAQATYATGVQEVIFSLTDNDCNFENLLPLFGGSEWEHPVGGTMEKSEIWFQSSAQ